MTPRFVTQGKPRIPKIQRRQTRPALVVEPDHLAIPQNHVRQSLQPLGRQHGRAARIAVFTDDVLQAGNHHPPVRMAANAQQRPFRAHGGDPWFERPQGTPDRQIHRQPLETHQGPGPVRIQQGNAPQTYEQIRTGPGRLQAINPQRPVQTPLQPCGHPTWRAFQPGGDPVHARGKRHAQQRQRQQRQANPLPETGMRRGFGFGSRIPNLVAFISRRLWHNAFRSRGPHGALH